MIEEADDRLRSWAEEAVPDVELCFDLPGSSNAQPSVSLYLTRIAPAAPQRSTRRNPLDLELHYLVTAWAESTEEEHALLGRLLVASASQSEFAPDLEPPGLELWQALGLAPRPSFALRVLARHDLPIERAPRVGQVLSLRAGALRPLEGLVLGPEDTPVAGARVALVGGGRAVHTDSHGRFRLAVSEVASQPLGLQIAARGLRRRLELAPDELPAGDEPLVISLELPED